MEILPTRTWVFLLKGHPKSRCFCRKIAKSGCTRCVGEQSVRIGLAPGVLGYILLGIHYVL